MTGAFTGGQLSFPNVETLVATFLAAQPALAGVHVGPDLPANWDNRSAAVYVQRVGGAYDEDQQVDQALIRLDTYGPTKTDALNLAGTARGLMPTLVRGVQGVSWISEDYGPQWFSDAKHDNAPRYMTRFRVTVHIGPKTA
ncbi:hypothetical protein [Kutzneria sp. NPDC052558]|uniref:hypothetical protein n=1 Tax=Kutzneria sp. NPDC052558 TaxID=3364121 RepID=UPI0037C64356